MDLQENYIIISDIGTASSFTTNFAYPIRVERKHKIALKSICYGSKFNVTDDNNRIYMKLDQKVPHSVKIENGWYSDTYFLFLAIAKAVDKWIDEFNNRYNHLEYCKVEYSTTDESVNLIFDEFIHVEHSNQHTDVLDLLDLQPGLWNKLKAKNVYFSCHYPVFLYTSIVENSYINNISSRLLAILPLRSGHSDGTDGYHFYEFNNPTYYNFGMSEFSQAKFELHDINGQLIQFDTKFKTILALEIFKPLDITH